MWRHKYCISGGTTHWKCIKHAKTTTSGAQAAANCRRDVNKTVRRGQKYWEMNRPVREKIKQPDTRARTASTDMAARSYGRTRTAKLRHLLSVNAQTRDPKWGRGGGDNPFLENRMRPEKNNIGEKFSLARPADTHTHIHTHAIGRGREETLVWDVAGVPFQHWGWRRMNEWRISPVRDLCSR